MRDGKKKRKKDLIWGATLIGMYVIMRTVAKHRNGRENLDAHSSYLNVGKNDGEPGGVYERFLKPLIDRGLAFTGLILLAPVFAGIALAIWTDDPGPVLFTQKRVGKDGHLFYLHKFRSMKMATPHDVPTHQLKDPEQYITRTGAFLRRTSLDELPQIWDIFRGKMSIIGPRPALWNQEDLVAEREKYGANGIFPGLTGWAQINGRDELEILEKARLDGEYVNYLKQGGIRALFFDVRCFMGTVLSVLKSEGVVEGGTGEMQKKETGQSHTAAGEAGFGKYGYKKIFTIDKTAEKKVLITGAGSYIGESFRVYAEKRYPNLIIDTIDMIDDSWREYDFTLYDAVFHVAGIAHADVGKVDEAVKAKYYAVNTELAIETCRKARDAGVRQFLFMSSMIIYGDSAPYGKKKVIDAHTIPAPANFYGDSKWQADVGVRALENEAFQVAVLRPPMIYGRGSKGNYQTLSKLAKRLPVFPDVKNERSMLYIDNLCEFVSLLILSGEGGVYFPQNKEYTKTADMVKHISQTAGKDILLLKLLNPFVAAGSLVPGKIRGLVQKAFGSSIYSQTLSEYKGLEYRVVGLEESVRKTEGERRDIGADTVENFRVDKNGDITKKKHILVISQYFYPETFRINDMAEEWVKRGYKVTVLTGIPNYPKGKFFQGYDYHHRRRENWHGMEIIRIPLIPRGSNSIGMIANYFSFMLSGWWWKITTDIRADFVFTFEVSPMTQALIGCWYSRKYHVPHFLYVQDLWPESIEATTGIHSAAVLRPLDRMVDYIYKNSDEIYATSQSFVNTIISRDRKVDKEKVHYWPQYAEEFYKPLDRKDVRNNANENSPLCFIPDDSRFKIAYTGNIGTAQGLDILPKTAERLKIAAEPDQENSICFVIVGDGRYQERFETEIRKRKVEDMFLMIPRQNAEFVTEILAVCDAAFLSFSDSLLWEMTIPAKLQTYMACGKPIIAAAKGETEQIIKEAQCGLCVEIGDVGGLAEAIEELRKSGEWEEMGKNSFAYYKSHYSKDILMNEMERFIERAIGQ